MTPERVRYRDPSRKSEALSDADREIIARLLTHEADMAYRRRAEILLEYLEIGDGDKIIDLGCGLGFYLMALSKLREQSPVGYDNDLFRLRQARAKNSHSWVVNGMLEDLPFAKASFDKVLLSEVLEHIPDDSRALAEIHRILKPGGILSISVPHVDYPFLWDPISRLRDYLGVKPLRSGPVVGIWTNHVRLYDPDSLLEILEDVGFEVELLEEATHYCFPFSHFLVYGIGKPLFERNLLPAGMRRAADRFADDRGPVSRLNPISIGVAIFRLFDRWNDRPLVANQRTFVNVLAKARKPGYD
jgi:SAM-dependent methyltransferase